MLQSYMVNRNARIVQIIVSVQIIHILEVLHLENIFAYFLVLCVRQILPNPLQKSHY